MDDLQNATGQKARQRRWYLKHRDIAITYARSYRKEYKEEVDAYNHAYRQSHREEIAATRCAYRQAHCEEIATYMAEYRAANKEQIRVYGQAYGKVNHDKINAKTARRRALRRKTTVEPIDYQAINTRDDMRCSICGRKVKPKELSYDHSVPLASGGTHTQTNLRVAHRSCNYRRGPGRLPVQLVLL